MTERGGMRALVTSVVQRIDPVSMSGALSGTLFFACSLTPSLLPRSLVFQAVVSGLSLAVGYMLGVVGRWLWWYLELPLPGAGTRRNLIKVTSSMGAMVAMLFLWQASEWQNSVRRLMGMEDVS